MDLHLNIKVYNSCTKSTVIKGLSLSAFRVIRFDIIQYSQSYTGLRMVLYQFSNQEPGTDADIAKFCELNYGGVKFPIMKKSDVNGNNTNDVSFAW